MKFDYLVKHNGIYYPAGADVPIEETKKSEGVKAPAPLVSGKVDDMDAEVRANSDKVWAEFDKKHSRKYSEEDLSLPYMKLKALAKKEGFKVENTAKANDIKEMLRSL